MFSLISGFINWYFSKPTYSILIIGEEQTGKTTFLEKLKHIHTGKGLPLEFISPTFGQNSNKLFIIKISLKFRNSRFWDVPGKESFRAMWSNYLEEIEGLIYIVDVNRLDIENSIQILNEFLGNKHLQKAEIPILILINKIDSLPLDSDKLTKVLNSIDYSKLRKKHFLVKETSGFKGTGLEDAIRWLYNSMKDYTKYNENEGKNPHLSKSENTYYHLQIV